MILSAYNDDLYLMTSPKPGSLEPYQGGNAQSLSPDITSAPYINLALLNYFS